MFILKKMMRKFHIFFAFLLCVFVVPSTQAQNSGRIIKETLISADADARLTNGNFTLSNNLQRIAYRVQEGKKNRVVVDSLPGNSYDSAGIPIFSADGNHFAYSAKDNNQSLLIIDHNQNQLLEKGLSVYFMQFAPDNKNLVYILFNGQYYFMVFHGLRSKAYESIDESSIYFSADGSKIAYIASKDHKQAIVNNGVEGQWFNNVGCPVLSPDGKRLAYTAVNGKETILITDDIVSRPYESISDLQFNKDSKHYACVAKYRDQYVIIYDGHEGEMFPVIHSPLFSPDGNHFVYAMELKDGDEKTNGNYAIADGGRLGPYSTIVPASFKYNNDGTILLFNVLKDTKNSVMVNGIEKANYKNVISGTAVFSPDNKHIAYIAEKSDAKQIANIDGVESKQYDAVYAVTFSPNSSKYAYSVKEGNHAFVVVDGKAGNSYDALLGSGFVLFNSENAFHYIVLKDKKIYLIEERFQP